MRDLKIDELESVSGGSYSFGTSLSAPLTLRVPTLACADAYPFTFCYFYR